MGDTGDDGTRLVGREDEERRMRAVVGAARNGTGGALLVTGEPGIGKTALLRAAVGDPDGVQVLRVDGYEAEATIPFAALDRLIAPLRAHVPDLPARHRQALDTAAGLVDGPPPDPYLVGLGVLGLLAAAAEDAPVIGAVDDLQWFDAESVSALAFVGRRLRVEPVALLFTARDDDRIDIAMAAWQSLVAVKDWTFLLGPGYMPALNALCLATIMYRSRLVPRIIPTVGLVAAPLLVLSSTITLFGGWEQVSGPALALALPIAAWELSLGVWMMVKGFKASSVAAVIPEPSLALAIA